MLQLSSQVQHLVTETSLRVFGRQGALGRLVHRALNFPHVLYPVEKNRVVYCPGLKHFLVDVGTKTSTFKTLQSHVACGVLSVSHSA